MDPADVHKALTSQVALHGNHDQLMKTLIKSYAATSRAVAELRQQVARVTGTAPPSAAATAQAGVRDLHACDPKPLKGDLDKWLLLQCRLVFEQRSLSFATGAAQVNFLIGLLKGKALTGHSP